MRQNRHTPPRKFARTLRLRRVAYFCAAGALLSATFAAFGTQIDPTQSDNLGPFLWGTAGIAAAGAIYCWLRRTRIVISPHSSKLTVTRSTVFGAAESESIDIDRIRSVQIQTREGSFLERISAAIEGHRSDREIVVLTLTPPQTNPSASETPFEIDPLDASASELGRQISDALSLSRPRHL